MGTENKGGQAPDVVTTQDVKGRAFTTDYPAETTADDATRPATDEAGAPESAQDSGGSERVVKGTTPKDLSR